MTAIGNSRPIHLLPLLSILLVLGILVGSLLALPPVALGAPSGHALRAAAPTRELSPAPGPIPAGTCTGPNTNFSVMPGIPGPISYTTSNGTSYAVGPAPLLVYENVTITGPQTVYSYSVDWGDGSAVNASTVNLTTAPSVVLNLTHFYTQTALYGLWIQVNWSCPGYGGGSWGGGPTIEVYGAGGPTPLAITPDVTVGTVPLDVNFSATVAGATPGMIAQWWLYQVDLGPQVSARWYNQTVANGTSWYATVLAVPGTFAGSLRIVYPGTGYPGLTYAIADLPQVTVNPLVWLRLAHTPLTGVSPWNVTFYGNVTTLGDLTYTGNGTVGWQFLPYAEPWNGSGNPIEWSTGPTAGPVVWQNVYWNVSFGTGLLLAVDRVVLLNGTIAAENTSAVALNNYFGPGPSLVLSATPSTGTVPFFFNATASLNVSANNTTPYGLVVTASKPGYVGWTNYTADDWLGHPITLMGLLTQPGVYLLVAYAVVNVSGQWLEFTEANITLVVGAIGGPPVLSLSASPASGAAPLNVTLSLVAVGGSGAYGLAVCVEGPFASPNGSGPCSAVASRTGWNGSALALGTTLSAAGNYTIFATVSTATGSNSTAFAPVAVTTAAPTAPLSAHASYLGPNGVTGNAARYGFVTSVTGGVAPYTIQWSFGDGTEASALPGSTVFHSYTTSGSYVASLTVTDGRGSQVHASVGPLLVSLPIGPAAPPPWWALGWVIDAAVLLAVASSVVLAAMLLRLAQRREALNWFREMEERPVSDEAAPRAR